MNNKGTKTAKAAAPAKTTAKKQAGKARGKAGETINQNTSASEGFEVNEPGMALMVNKGGIVRWLGGAAHVKQDIRSDFDLLKAGELGITKASVEALTRHIGISKKSMAEEVLNISIKTLERKDASGKMDKRTSSHVLEVARVMQHAFEVFEHEEKARQWLNRENRSLNSLKPVQLLDTLTGINMVNDTLTRIEEGVYS